LPVAEEFGETGLNLPLHPNMSQDNVEYIVKKVKEFNES
jgi:dTDP-4-amino-4,6-dideoxygalactose transaminase